MILAPEPPDPEVLGEAMRDDAEAFEGMIKEHVSEEMKTELRWITGILGMPYTPLP